MPKKSKKPARSAAPKQESSGLQFSETDLLGQLTANEGSVLWLGRCTASEIRRTLEAAGLLAALRDKGINDLIFKIEPFEEFDQTLKVYCREEKPDNLIAEARFREKRFAPERKMPETFSDFAPAMLSIDWLLMQNPFAEFTQDRPRLPGQTHPGLGQAHRVTTLLMDLCAKLGLAGILNFPEHFHNAHLYREHFHFYDPVSEGIAQALFRDLSSLPLADLSWAIEQGCVRDGKTGSAPLPSNTEAERGRERGERFEWNAGVQILPMHPAMRDYFASAWYRRRVQEIVETNSFVLDKNGFQKFGRNNSGVENLHR